MKKLRSLVAWLAPAVFLLYPALTKAQDADVLAAAQAEGEFVIYTSQNTPFMESMTAKFEADVPGVRMQVLRAPSSDILAKILAERGAGTPTADVYVAWWDTVSELVKNNYLADIAPADSADFTLRDSNNKWIAVGAYANVIGYNTNNVAADAVPKGYMDLTDPKWKGRVGLVDPRTGGGAYVTYYAIWELHGKDFFTGVGSNEPFIQRQASGIVNAVGAGQIDFGVSQESLWLEAKNQGAPIEVVYPEEGLSLNYWIASMLDNAPHPNAARVFLDWLVSEKGQVAMATSANPIYALRPGVSGPTGSPALTELKINPIDLNDFQTKQAEITAEASAAFGLADE